MWLIHRIEFPKLGIVIEHLPESIVLFGDVELTIYGLFMGLAILAGFLMVQWQAVRTDQDKEIYLDFVLYAVPLALIGARICYVIFAWEEFREDPMQILIIRDGGMAVYGGILTGILVAVVYTRIRKMSFWRVVDTACVGLVAGQIIGRWGDFFNRESFGGYTDNTFSMRLSISDVAASSVTEEMLLYAEQGGYAGYIQVHPVFLYECLWNLVLLFILLAYTRYKKFDGELFLLYLIGYGAGRVWLESLRTDQLLLWGTELPVFQLVSVIFVAIGFVIWLSRRIWMARKSAAQWGEKNFLQKK